MKPVNFQVIKFKFLMFSTRFYTLATDAVSILVAVNSLLRIFVYMLCSPRYGNNFYQREMLIFSIRTDLCTEFPIFRVFQICGQNGKKLQDDRRHIMTSYQPIMLGAPPSQML